MNLVKYKGKVVLVLN